MNHDHHRPAQRSSGEDRLSDPSAVNSFVARNLWDEKGSCARTKIKDEHLAEINAVFPTVSASTKLRTFQVSPDIPKVAPQKRARIISVIEF